MSPLTRVVTLSVPPIALLISVTHLVAADRSPGDGFTAGIISSLGLTLQYVTLGYREAHRRLGRVRFARLVVIGLAVALAASVLPLLAGEPLLAAQELSLELPAVGTLRLTRAMLFDLGVYLVVMGGTMTAVDTLGRAAR